MRRHLGLTGALAALVTALPAAALVPSAPADAASRPGSRADRALTSLRAASGDALRVRRTADGTVGFLAARDGRSALKRPSGVTGPVGVARAQLTRFGAAFGLDGTTSRAVVTSALPSATGSVVRATQVVDGVPVFGGQVVTSLDEKQGVTAFTAATTPARQVAAPRVSQQRAAAVAVAATAKAHQVAARTLTASAQGRHLYDPRLVHVASDPLGVRPVWQFEVRDGSTIRETVLIGTGRGEVALHFNDAPDLLSRRICDNANRHTVSSAGNVPLCSTGAARIENGKPSRVSDVNYAYNNLGATAAAYRSIAGVDLTALVGRSYGGHKRLMSTVRWCYKDYPCPFDNAFWDGRQMVFGNGFAKADDVVGHELTHGFIEKTSNLFSYHQSGALNESLADTIGEIVDHRHGTESDASWIVGEDLGKAYVRYMANPTRGGQPDHIRSSLWDASDFYEDNGAVHQDDGVGNKTAYLISHGGTFNGQTVHGIDGSDTRLTKTGLLYLTAIPTITSGAQYADWADALEATCDQLASGATAGFTTGDCDNVRRADLATELRSAPLSSAAGPRQTALACPSGTVNLIGRDDDGDHSLGLDSSSPLWGIDDASQSVVPPYAESGTESVYGLDPDPQLGDPGSGSLVTGSFALPSATGGTYLHFHHAYGFDYDGRTYYDGGRVIVQKRVGSAWQEVTTGLVWKNGPTRRLEGTPSGVVAFGGDSHGWGSSRVDLSSLAGQTVRVLFRVQGDRDAGGPGWWLDDLRLYSCG